MSRALVPLLLLVGSLVCAHPAAAETGWYLQADYGLAEPDDGEGSARTNDGMGGDSFSEFEVPFDSGPVYGLAVGYAFGQGRLELEYRQLSTDVKEPAASMLLSNGFEASTVFVNLWMDFVEDGDIRPYIGAGLGRSEMQADNGSSGAAAGQLGAGVDFVLSDDWVVATGYRYVEMGGLEYQQGDTAYTMTWSGSQFTAGLRYTFFDCGDADADGVCDKLDACPASPVGLAVDASGCTLDEDRDGVPDGRDKCPGTKRGAEVDTNGCRRDADDDGVYDDEDQCPETPRGTRVDAVGCPRDGDQDGVIDAQDECPQTPRGQQVMSNGCAPDQSVVLRGVNFEFDRDVLTPNAREILDQMVRVLTASPGFVLELQGHTDDRGSGAYNKRLSAARARAVKQYLVDEGVDADRLIATGYGESAPRTANDTEAGRAENRRVEAKIIEKR